MSSSELFAPASTTVVIEGSAAVEAYLAEHIGVAAAALVDALAYGMAEAATVSGHAAASSFGTRLWDGVLTRLRDLLVNDRGWRVVRPGGLEVVRRADLRVQITPSMGNEATGVRAVGPSCKHDRGESTQIAIERNQLTLGDLVPNDQTWQPVQTWWLLYHVFHRSGEQLLRAELSLPTRVIKGRITDWSHRLLLGELPFGSAEPARIPAPAPEPQVTLRRRASS